MLLALCAYSALWRERTTGKTAINIWRRLMSKRRILHRGACQRPSGSIREKWPNPTEQWLLKRSPTNWPVLHILSCGIKWRLMRTGFSNNQIWMRQGTDIGVVKNHKVWLASAASAQIKDAFKKKGESDALVIFFYNLDKAENRQRGWCKSIRCDWQPPCPPTAGKGYKGSDSPMSWILKGLANNHKICDKISWTRHGTEDFLDRQRLLGPCFKHRPQGAVVMFESQLPISWWVTGADQFKLNR